MPPLNARTKPALSSIYAGFDKNNGEEKMENQKFPKVKNVVVKRTKNGQRYLLHDKDSCGNDIYVTIPIVDTDTDKDYFRKIRECRIKLSAKKNGSSIQSLINEYAEKRQLAKGSVYALNLALRGFTLDNDNNKRQMKRLMDSDYKRSTLKSLMAFIRSFFKWIILGNRVEGIVDPTLDFAVKHSVSGRSRTLTEEEEEKMFARLKRIKDIELKLMILLAYHTGARASSIYVLTTGSLKDNKIYYYNVKTRKNYDYAVPIYDDETISLFNMLAARGFLFSKSLQCYQSKAWRLFTKLFGKDQHGETISLHSLRHTFATKAIQNGVPPEIVSRLLDHSSPAITLKIYGKHSEQQLEDAILKMSRKKE